MAIMHNGAWSSEVSVTATCSFVSSSYCSHDSSARQAVSSPSHSGQTRVMYLCLQKYKASVLKFQVLIMPRPRATEISLEVKVILRRFKILLCLPSSVTHYFKAGHSIM